jgi:hypothetical protein
MKLENLKFLEIINKRSEDPSVMVVVVVCVVGRGSTSRCWYY